MVFNRFQTVPDRFSYDLHADLPRILDMNIFGMLLGLFVAACLSSSYLLDGDLFLAAARISAHHINAVCPFGLWISKNFILNLKMLFFWF